MLELYYTGPRTQFREQTDRSASLGGKISNSLIPNEFLNNLFGPISKVNPDFTSLVMAIRNVATTQLTGVSLYIDNKVEYLDYQIGFQEYSLDNNGDLISERLINNESSPQFISLSKSNNSLQPISLPDIDTGTYLAVYLKRNVNSELSNVSFTRDELVEAKELGDPLSLYKPCTNEFKLNFSFTVS
jgi:hypothetical protein